MPSSAPCTCFLNPADMRWMVDVGPQDLDDEAPRSRGRTESDTLVHIRRDRYFAQGNFQYKNLGQHALRCEVGARAESGGTGTT